MKKISKLFYLFAMGLALSSCASSSYKDEVLARSDDLSSRPEWAKEGETFRIEKGTVYMLGTHEMSVVGKRLTTGYRVAENNAKSGLSGAIESRLSFIFQNAEEGDDMDADQIRFIGGESSKLVASSIRPDKRYWEKVSVVVDADGNRDLVYRIYAQVSMPEADFKKAIKDAIRRNSGKKGISPEFAKKVDSHWDQMSE